MKHSGFRIDIETEENGYCVNRNKAFFAWSDRAIVMTISDEIDKWLVKGKSGKVMITVSGSGTYKIYHAESFFRVIIDQRYSDHSIVTWYNNNTRKEDFPDVKALKPEIKRHLAILAENIDYSDTSKDY